MKKSIVFLNILAAFLLSCGQNEKTAANTNLPKWEKPERIAYEIKNGKEWLEDSTKTGAEQELVFALNRTDRPHFMKMDSVVIPVDQSGDLVYYFPFPLEVSSLKDIKKIVFFSYATQTFAAYENGVLVRTGPTNMGREKDQTPTGLFFTNWKAKKTISTFNDEWELRWNFNIANKAGVGWHQYSLPGYPASHSCLRLSENDAKYLYDWADKWVLENKNKIRVKGTPVIVFGSYDFKAPKPWLKLIENRHALDISENELKNVAEPFLNEILMEQQKRIDFQSQQEMIEK